MNVELIANQFAIAGSVSSVTSFGGGHINDTYHVLNGTTGKPSYLLQKVNSFVFKDIEVLMNNMSTATLHIRKKLLQNNCLDIERRALMVIKTKGEEAFVTNDGQYWRMFNFIEDHQVYNNAPNVNIAFEGARMFGEFLNLLSDLPISSLRETIPDFHNLKQRLRNLEAQIKEDKVGRLKLVKDDISYVKSSYEIMTTIQNLGDKGLIPLRITHNDTKINNVLFDENNKGLCIVDLDTVMPGYAHYDFGDGIRSTANTGKEDDEDLKNVTYDMAMFEAFSAGYLESTRLMLNDAEISALANASLLFPFIMGVRFLTDYLEGDVYYKTHSDNHNLIRARAQFKLAQDGESKLKEMNRIIKSLN